MAIAPLAVEVEQEDRYPAALRLVPGGRPLGAAPRGAAVHARREVSGELDHSISAHPAGTRRQEPASPLSPSYPLPTVEHPVTAAARSSVQRQIRRQNLARRRRTVAVVGVVAAGILLALPIRALGAMTMSGQETPGGVTAGLPDGSTYVVQAGDTLHSIALRINPAAAPRLERQMAASIGAKTVVPGEHITVP